VPSRGRGTHRSSQLAGGIVLVCAIAIACANECGRSSASPVSFVNPMAQKRKAVDIIESCKLALEDCIRPTQRCVHSYGQELKPAWHCINSRRSRFEAGS
jgi:hypothetical protein